MNDYGKAVLEQYEVEVESVKRGRGSLICYTTEGTRKLQEYKGSKSHLELEQQVLLHIQKQSDIFVDCYVRTKEGILYAVHPNQTVYVCKEWLEGVECNRSNVDEVTLAVQTLAKIHVLLRTISIPEVLQDKNMVLSPLLGEYEKHLREMKRVRQYVREKKKKNEYEKVLLDTCEDMIAQAEEAMKSLQQSAYMKLYEKAKQQNWMVHGTFHYHNILFTKNRVMVTNFEKCGVQVQVIDLYLFMRKVLEKNGWNRELGERMLEAYNHVLPLSQDELKILGFLFLYPEKYWKQINFYYNRKKSWIPTHNLEKLQKTARQQELTRGFVCVGLNV